MSRLRFAVFAALIFGWGVGQRAFAQEFLLESPAIERLPALETLEPELVETPKPVTPPAAPSKAQDEIVDAPVVVMPDNAPKKPWSGNFDLGLNGSEGGSNIFNFRFNLAAIRETDATKFTIKSNYIRTQADGEESGNRLFIEGRNEWKFGESPWSIFIHQTTEYDEFQPFRTRIGMDTGLSRKLIQNDKTTLSLRFGPSTSHEFRGPTQDWVPELGYGSSLEHKLSQRQKLIGQIDYFPDVRDVSDYRITTQVAWEIVIDEVNNLSLKISALDRYDSTPSGGTPNALDYAATLLWSF